MAAPNIEYELYNDGTSLSGMYRVSWAPDPNAGAYVVDQDGTEYEALFDFDNGKYYYLANPKNDPKHIKVKALPEENTDYEESDWSNTITYQLRPSIRATLEGTMLTINDPSGLGHYDIGILSTVEGEEGEEVRFYPDINTFMIDLDENTDPLQPYNPLERGTYAVVIVPCLVEDPDEPGHWYVGEPTGPLPLIIN